MKMALQKPEDINLEYICGWLNKKEDGNKWVEYWVVILGRLLKCHRCEPKNKEHAEDYLIGWIELTCDTKCINGKTKDCHFPFYIEKRGKRYLFKTMCPLLRARWINMIELAIQGVSPEVSPTKLSDDSGKHESTCVLSTPTGNILSQIRSTSSTVNTSCQSFDKREYTSLDTDKVDSKSLNEEDFVFINSLEFNHSSNLKLEENSNKSKKNIVKKMFTSSSGKYYESVNKDK